MLTPSVSIHDRINGAKNELRKGNLKSPEKGIYAIPDSHSGEVHAHIEENGDIALSLIDIDGRVMGRGTLIFSSKQNDFPGIMQPFSNGPNPLPLSDSQELGREIKKHYDSVTVDYTSPESANVSCDSGECCCAEEP